ncbi:MAG: addiction module protein [Myxococcales bacterium]|nr:addiction module protein [Myxococcales bacterium]
MAPRADLLDELLRLPFAERATLAAELLRSLETDEVEAEVPSTAWATELERRVAQQAPGVPAVTVLDEGRRRLSQRR